MRGIWSRRKFTFDLMIAMLFSVYHTYVLLGRSGRGLAAGERKQIMLLVEKHREARRGSVHALRWRIKTARCNLPIKEALSDSRER